MPSFEEIHSHDISGKTYVQQSPGVLQEAPKSLSSVLIEKEVGKEANDHKMEFSSFEKLQKEVEPLYKSIETEIHSRLHPHGN